MQLLENLSRLVCRFRYPVSLPEDVANDLGMHLPNSLKLHDFIELLSSPQNRPKNLHKLMPREQAEEAFGSALKKESFKSCSLFSYDFNKNWLVIALYYDENERLRRLHLQCPACADLDGFDIPLDEAEEILAAACSH